MDGGCTNMSPTCGSPMFAAMNTIPPVFTTHCPAVAQQAEGRQLCSGSPRPALFLAVVKPTNIYFTLIPKCGKEQGRDAPAFRSPQTNEAVERCIK